MSRGIDVLWRLTLAGLFLALFVLVNLRWLQVEMSLAVRGQEELLNETVYAQSGLSIARGEVPRVTGSRLAMLMYLFPELASQLGARQIPGSWWLTLYGPLLLLGLVLCFAMSPGRLRGGVLLALTLLALSLLLLQQTLGYPLAAQIEDFNRAVGDNPKLNDPEGTFLRPPSMVLVTTAAPTTSVILLLVASVVAGLGRFWPARENPPV